MRFYCLCPTCGDAVVVDGEWTDVPKWHGFPGGTGHMFEMPPPDRFMTYDELRRAK